MRGTRDVRLVQLSRSLRAVGRAGSTRPSRSLLAHPTLVVPEFGTSEDTRFFKIVGEGLVERRTAAALRGGTFFFEHPRRGRPRDAAGLLTQAGRAPGDLSPLRPACRAGLAEQDIVVIH